MTTTTDQPTIPTPRDLQEAAQGAPQPPADAPADPQAPYGRTPSGRARTAPLTGKRGRPRGSGTGRRQQPRTSTIGAPGAGRARTTTRPTDYRPAIMRLTSMVTLPLAFRAPVDAATVNAHMAGDNTAENPGLARAISHLAVEEPRVAAVLDRLMTAGPYAEVIGAALPMAVQLLTNHRRIPVPVAERLGAVDPAVIAAQLDAEGAHLADAA